ncbi:MAG: hypothetical protein HOE54_12295, partial [Gammaproteobacteria bacterium]|nr:hypothetical protein [Gammaproteobacteria bacterium]
LLNADPTDHHYDPAVIQNDPAVILNDPPVILNEPSVILNEPSVILSYRGRARLKDLDTKPRARIFLGDNGAYVLGFLVVALFLMATQSVYKGGSQVLTPVTALWLLFIPLIDIARVIWIRSRAGRWPVSDDRLHLHYILRDRGFSTGKVVNLMFVTAMATAGIGVFFYYSGISESWSYLAFMTLCVLYFVVTNRMVRKNHE